MKIKFFYLLTFLFSYTIANSQTLEELKSKKAEVAKIAAEKQAEADKYKGEVAALQSQITVLSGWKKSVFGGVGFNLNNSNDWQTNAFKNSSAATFNGSLNAIANRQAAKYFWNNSGVLNLGWLKFDNKDDAVVSDKFNRNTDVLRLASLFGYKVKSWVAISALGEYSSSLFNFNNPGISDIGFGATLTPVQDLVVVIHPLNYHVGFGSKGVSTQSSVGAKIRADYSRKFGGLSWASTLTTFLPYGAAPAAKPSLFEYTWLNTFGFNLWKGIGVGFTLGLRKADFETFRPVAIESRKGVNQSFNSLGLSYAF